MSTIRIRTAAAVFSLAAWAALIPVGIANADCTTPGDFGAGAGCPPPGSSGSGNTESWPPTSIDWPPQLKSDSGDSQGSSGADTKTTPIVMPSGQTAAPPTSTSGSGSTSTSTSAKPIVPVGSASTVTTAAASATPTPIVTPQG